MVLYFLGIVLKKESFTNYGDIKRLDKTQSITSMCFQTADKKTNVSLHNLIFVTLCEVLSNFFCVIHYFYT